MAVLPDTVATLSTLSCRDPCGRNSMSKVHILGAGSIGSLFAHHLAAAGIPTTLLVRSPSKLAALTAVKGQITVERPGIGTSSQVVQGEVVNPPARLGQEAFSSQQKIQQLIVTTKANQAIEALSFVQHRLDSSSVVVLLQNGVLGVYQEAIRSLFPQQSSRPAFLLGSTTHGAYRKDDFHVVHVSCGAGSSLFGVPPLKLTARAIPHAAVDSNSACSSTTSSSYQPSNQTQQQQALQQQQHARQLQQQQKQSAQELLSLLGNLHDLQPDVQLTSQELEQQLLLKLVVNCCVNPLTALLHCRNGGLVGNIPAGTVFSGVIAECKQVFDQALPNSEDELFATVIKVAMSTKENLNSMLQDVMKGSLTEVDYLNGYVVQVGAAKGVPTPWNSMLALLVKAWEAMPHDMLIHTM